MIIKYNSSRLAHADEASGSGDLWSEVRRLTKPASASRSIKFSDKFSADILNTHYAAISKDPDYIEPDYMATALSPTDGKVTDIAVFHLLDNLKPTSSGIDNIPSWFLRLGAPIFCAPLAPLFNLSLGSAIVPTQSKTAIIHPIAKISEPLKPSDMRPVSVLPVLSCTLERIVVSNSDAFHANYSTTS